MFIPNKRGTDLETKLWSKVAYLNVCGLHIWARGWILRALCLHSLLKTSRFSRLVLKLIYLFEVSFVLGIIYG